MAHSRITPDGLRISYTALSLWKRGDEQGLLSYLYGQSFTPTPQMLEGSTLDKKAADEVMQTNRLIPEFGWYELVAPIAHLKLESKIVPDVLATGVKPFVLVGEIDVYDRLSGNEGVIYELKTGVTLSATYAHTMQTKLYALLATLHHLPVTKILVCHHNQYTLETDVHKVLITKRMIRNTYKELLVDVYAIQQFLETVTTMKT